MRDPIWIQMYADQSEMLLCSAGVLNSAFILEYSFHNYNKYELATRNVSWRSYVLNFHISIWEKLWIVTTETSESSG